MGKQQVTAIDIKMALAKKHEIRGDFFAAECKTGPTGTGVLIFDGLAIHKSWANPCIVGYEIKVSRSDFKRDAKYIGYMPFCHELYFVVPTGLIDRAEVEENIGLIYYSQETGKLTTKRKALHRHIDISTDLLMYIIMQHGKSDKSPFFSSDADYWRAWLKNKKENIELGGQVKRALREELGTLRRAARNAKSDKEELQEYEKTINEVKRILSDYHRGHITHYNLPDILKKALEKSSPVRLDDIEMVLQKSLVDIRRLKNEVPDG